MPVQKLLKEKTRSVSEAVALVKSGDTVDYGFGLTQSTIFDTELASQKDRLRDVIVRGTLSTAAR
ncbi:MAG: 4-hydroxybutyrate CoA-transferase, partial [Cycloclasticus sp.]